MTDINCDAELKKVMKRIKLADRLRIIFLFLSLFMVVFVFYENKFAAEMSWYLKNRMTIYIILGIVVLIMLIATIAKTFLAARYKLLLGEESE